jgi:hypothetical protein
VALASFILVAATWEGGSVPINGWVSRTLAIVVDLEPGRAIALNPQAAMTMHGRILNWSSAARLHRHSGNPAGPRLHTSRAVAECTDRHALGSLGDGDNLIGCDMNEF